MRAYIVIILEPGFSLLLLDARCQCQIVWINFFLFLIKACQLKIILFCQPTSHIPHLRNWIKKI